MKRSFKSEQRACCCIRPPVIFEGSRASFYDFIIAYKGKFVIILDVNYI